VIEEAPAKEQYKVSIPFKSGLSVIIDSMKRDDIASALVSIPFKSGLSVIIFFRYPYVTKRVSIPFKSGLSVIEFIRKQISFIDGFNPL